VHPRHDEVEKDKLGFLCFGDRQSIKAVVGFKDRKTLAREVMRIKTAQKIFVVNNKYFFVQEISANICRTPLAIFLPEKVWISLSKCNIA